MLVDVPTIVFDLISTSVADVAAVPYLCVLSVEHSLLICSVLLICSWLLQLFSQIWLALFHDYVIIDGIVRASGACLLASGWVFLAGCDVLRLTLFLAVRADDVFVSFLVVVPSLYI